MNILIIDDAEYAKRYRDGLTDKFPEANFRTAHRHDGDFAEAVGEADVIFSYAYSLSDSLIAGAGNLKWIQAQTTGVDGIVDLPSLRPDVILTTTRGIHAAAVSETALIHMLALARDMKKAMQNQDNEVWERWRANLLEGKAVGILGIGTISEDLAPKCKAFGMTVIGFSARRDVAGFDRIDDRDKLQEIAPELDYLVNLIPHTAETQNMLGAELWAAMKPTSYFVNVGRGETVDDAALIDALNRGEIAGAGLDVFVAQPLPPGHPYWAMANVNITPHNGGRYEGIIEKKLPIFETNLRAFLAGTPDQMINVVER